MNCRQCFLEESDVADLYSIKSERKSKSNHGTYCAHTWWACRLTRSSVRREEEFLGLLALSTAAADDPTKQQQQQPPNPFSSYEMSTNPSRRSSRLATSLKSAETLKKKAFQALNSDSSSEGMSEEEDTTQRKTDKSIDDDAIMVGTGSDQSESDSYSSSSGEDVRKTPSKGRRQSRKNQGKETSKKVHKKGSPNAKKKISTKKTTSSKKKGPDSERICPHCKKVFSIYLGLAYHLGRCIFSNLVFAPLRRSFS